MHASVDTAASAELSQDGLLNPTLYLTDSEVICHSMLSLQLGLDLVNMYIHENLNYTLLPANSGILIWAQWLNTCNTWFIVCIP